MPELPNGQEIRDRAVGLFSFLKEFVELRTKTVRSIEEYEEVVWLADIPRERECVCAAWSPSEDTEEDAWLSVRRPRLNPPPLPRADLAPWIDREQIDDSEIEEPTLRDSISVSIEDETGAQRIGSYRLADHPEIRAAWEDYVLAEWWPWREEDRRAQAVQKVYTKLFSLYQKQQRLGEEYEVIVGIGLLSWATPDHADIRRHLIAASVSISFDASRGIISVGPAGEGSRPTLEQDMLDPRLRPEPEHLRQLEAQTAELGDNPWRADAIDRILRTWIQAVSPLGVYSEDLSPPHQATLVPRMQFAPAVILRKRTDRSYVRAFQEIISQLQNGLPVPGGVAQYVTVIESPMPTEGIRSDATSELYFPLESNDQQRQIASTLAHRPGVLVQGPPGTGKSHTIINLVCHLLASGQRVLVTSHAARALRVLRSFLSDKVPEILPLAVVLLGDDSEALRTMTESVQGITQRHHTWDAESSARKIRDIESQLDSSRREEARVFKDLCALREREIIEHSPRLGYGGTLQAIATRLSETSPKFGWLQDPISEEHEAPMSSQELTDLLSLLRDGELAALGSQGFRALDPVTLPTPEKISALVDAEARARAGYDELSEARKGQWYISIAQASSEVRRRIIEGIDAFVLSLDKCHRLSFDWIGFAVLQVVTGHDRTWRDRLGMTRNHLSAIGDRARWADETPVSGLGGRDHDAVRVDASDMRTHLEQGGRWGVGPVSFGLAKRVQYLRQEVKVGGRACETADVLGDLVAWLEIENHIRFIREEWAQFHGKESRAFATQVIEFEELAGGLEQVLELHEMMERVRSELRSISCVSEPSWHSRESLIENRNQAAAAERQSQFLAVRESISAARAIVAEQASLAEAESTGDDLLRAIDARDIGGYHAAFEQARRNSSIADRIRRREDLLTRLRSAVPTLTEELVTTAQDEVWGSRARQFEEAWDWARASGWVRRISAPQADLQTQLRLDTVRDRVRGLLKTLASEKAWAHCFARMTEHERQHLVAWAKAVRNIGKGTGKYVAMHRRYAREHMNECRTAIPAWVMPLYRVAETIRPGGVPFDVVIVDEASQSGPEALLLTYLARKIIVVGDDKQISPTYAGIIHEDVVQLRTRFLGSLPHHDSFGLNYSFFDLAEIRYQGRIRLREHFRCMPEIIQFSNNLCYQSEPLIPLRQYGASRLTPVVSARYVPDGYMKGSGHLVCNPPEALAIVEEIVRMSADPTYRGRTFGVISLLGEQQAREIESLLLQRLGPEKMEEMQLVCGDAYAFQGDQRHVMLLSMVSARSETHRIGTLADEASIRRFNVAASRAQDQMLLFHSVSPEDLSPHCVRLKLLRYCMHPAVEQAAISGLSLAEIRHRASVADRGRVPSPPPFDSWFEVDVFLRISARGYRVLPQYQVHDRRIDLVVEGMSGRVAVECYGDHWHGPEQYEKDVARQRELERCKWKFCTIWGSAYGRDPEGAMESLWDTLEREGVYPEGRGSPAAPAKVDVEHAAQGNAASPTPPLVRANPAGVPPSTELCGSSVQGSRTDDEGIVGSHRPKTTSGEGARATLVGYGDSPYAEWAPTAPLPDPATAEPWDLIPGLAEIVKIEGPMSDERLFHVFARGAGGQKVGAQRRRVLERALRAACFRGLLEEHRASDHTGQSVRVVSVSGSRNVVIRPRGPRDFSEVPDTEVSALMLRLRQGIPGLRGSALHRAVLAFYDIKRMTVNIEERLRWIDEHIDQSAEVRQGQQTELPIPEQRTDDRG